MLAFLVGVGGLYAPAPAVAQVSVVDPACNAAEELGLAEDKLKWLENIASIGEILDGVTSIYKTSKKWFETLLGSENLVAALISLSREMENKVDVQIAQAQSVTAVQNVLLEADMKTAGKYVKPPTQHLCKSVLVSQLGSTTQEFKQNVARLAASAIEAMYRGANADGDGPQYARDNYIDRCAAGLGSPQDYPAECVDSSITGTNGKKLADADLDMCTISGNQILEIPEFDVKEINGQKYNVPNPQNAAQRFWVAGLYYCFNLAGPRPSPPYGDKMKTPEGMRAKAQWNVCAARQSAILKPCLELLAENTRPNSSMKSLIAFQKSRCTEADNAKVSIPPSFEKCEKGLTPAQASFLTESLTKSSQYYVAQVMSGASHGKLLEVNIESSLSWNLWKETKVKMQNKVISSIQGIQELQDCWKAAARWGAR